MNEARTIDNNGVLVKKLEKKSLDDSFSSEWV